MDDAGGFARWSYPLLPMLVLFTAGTLTFDEAGFQFPLVAAGILGATAGFAVLMLRPRAGFVLRASEGFLWTIALASVRAQYVPAGWLTYVSNFAATTVGVVMAYLLAAMAEDRSARVMRRVFITLTAIAIGALTVGIARARSVEVEDVAGLEPVPVARWSKSSSTGTAPDCASIEARRQCPFVVDRACVGTSPAVAEGMCTNWEGGCLATCDAVSMDAWRLPDGRVIVSETRPGLLNGEKNRGALNFIDAGRMSAPVPYARLRKPPPLPSSWLWMAAGGLAVAAAGTVAWLVRVLARRRLHARVPADGPYRQTAGVPDAPRDPPSALWRYARLLVLAALLPATVSMVARVALATFP